MKDTGSTCSVLGPLDDVSGRDDDARKCVAIELWEVKSGALAGHYHGVEICVTSKNVTVGIGNMMLFKRDAGPLIWLSFRKC